ncbi:hypothetical protein PHABIO_306 [Pseudomonas phage Phabio]|uniref:Uncharacterized protein n=1 Tax=Pseudomonas phage Phabio TaxID=2006668 RepID=A0A1Y0T259_9CAUD|nr:hypothetical protein MZD05_gp306 [Pseudomonas phage Phabio]ARV76937.1 hypothetical protein PHABIO_306 [Pseudomonas phage Phabio]
MSIMALLEKQIKDPTRVNIFSFSARNESMFQIDSVTHMEELLKRRCRTKDLYDSEIHYGLSQGRLAEREKDGTINRGIHPTTIARKQI